MANIVKRRKVGKTTRTTTSTSKGIKSTLSQGSTTGSKAGSIRNTYSYKNGPDGQSAYHTVTHRNSSGYTRTTKKIGAHKKPGRKAKFKGSPTKRSRTSRQKGYDVDLDVAQSIGLIFLSLIALGFIMFTEFMILLLAIILVVWIVHKAAGEEPKENGEEK